jgi:hypothetical protein
MKFNSQQTQCRKIKSKNKSINKKDIETTPTDPRKPIKPLNPILKDQIRKKINVKTNMLKKIRLPMILKDILQYPEKIYMIYIILLDDNKVRK